MLRGSCHCGAVQWRFDGEPESATACNCTVCRRCGTLRARLRRPAADRRWF
ncbi:GFA family protein [Aquabacterium humicola]|uniref:GFA family protein n=1 Tax=Aquabacterium humicola TaxID=3237377 RepID=UPI003F74CE3C